MSSKKAEARERVKAMREEQAKKELKQARMMRFGIGGAVLAAVLIIAVAVATTRGGGDDAVAALPDTVTEEGGGIVDGSADAPVTIDVWVDFLCPHCKDFEDLNAQAIDEIVDAGQAKVVYHPLTFTGGVYSGRANNAFACAVAEGELRSFKTAAFAAPSQWTNNSLVELGESIGLGDEYESCVRDDTYGDWSTAVLEQASEAEVTGTPTVMINGTVLDSSQWTPEGITAAVTSAAAGETPAATPPAGETPAATPPAGETPAATPAATE